MKKSRCFRVLSVALVTVFAVVISPSERATAADFVIREAAGTIENITPAVEQFRVDLGGGKSAGANGLFGGVRREINWDAVPDQFSSPNDLPTDFFNTRSPRGVVFTTPGITFLVSAKGSAAKQRFSELNPTYSTEFTAFSPERIFTAVGSTVTEVNFFVAGTQKKAGVRGFGVVFTDVDSPESTKLELLDAAGVVIASAKAPAAPGNGRMSFLGLVIDTPTATRARITSGGLILGDGSPDGAFASRDKVAMDDFIYSEPIELPAPAVTTSTPSTVAPPATTATTKAPTSTQAVTTKKAAVKKSTKKAVKRRT